MPYLSVDNPNKWINYLVAIKGNNSNIIGEFKITQCIIANFLRIKEFYKNCKKLSINIIKKHLLSFPNFVKGKSKLYILQLNNIKKFTNVIYFKNNTKELDWYYPS